MMMPGQGADRKLDRSVVLADMARGPEGGGLGVLGFGGVRNGK